MKTSLSDDIRRSIGPVAHDLLVRQLGGKRVFIPRHPGAHHPLTETLGPDLARRLGDEFGGLTYEVPLTQRVRERIIADLKDQVAVALIIERYWVSRSTVFRIKAEMAQLPELQSRQGRLF